MAHNPKKQKSNAEKIDQLIDVVGSLAKSIHTINERVAGLESNKSLEIESEAPDPKVLLKEPVNYEPPYLVMKVDAIIEDNSIYGQGGQKKLFSGFKKFFNNRKEAGAFIDEMKIKEPGAIYEMMPA